MAYFIRLILVAMLFCGNFSTLPAKAWAAGGVSPREARNEILDQEAQRLMSEFALLRRRAGEDCARCDEEAQKRCADQIARMEELAAEARSLARNYSAQKDAMEQNARDILKMLEKFAKDIGAGEIAQMAGKAAAEIALGAMVGNVPGLLIGIGVAIADIAVEIRNRGIAAREKQHIIDAAERQGKEIKKAGELIQQFDQLAKDMESDIAGLKIKRKNCKKPAPPETGGTIIDKGTEVSKVKIKDASTGKPLDGDTIVIPKDPDGTTTKGPDNTYVPKEGDTVIFSAPCHEKKKIWVGREPIPEDLKLNPRPLRFVINCGDSAAIENIRKALNEQGVTFAPECLKRQKEWVRGSGPAAPNYCKEIVNIDCYTIQRGPAPGEQPAKLKCPDDIVVPAGPGPDPSQPGNFEPDYWREGQAKAKGKAEPSADPLYNSSGTWGQCYDDQWGLKRVGFSSAAAKDSLWPQYAQPLTVAVIDTGVDMLHPDLLGAVWVNTKETPGNNIDDDKNGYVDDIHGWNFVDKDNDISDNNGHGTIVAGIIAAWNGNGIGISGVNPWARIMPVKATDFNNKGWSIDLARAIRYAVDNGARVINASIGGETPSEAEKLALDYAQQKGVLVVVAAGNKGINTKDFSPASFENVITVASTDVNDKRVNFSNWGRSVDIAAPGTDILSLHAAGTDYLVFERDDYKGGFAVVGEDKRYYRTSGSSFSAPFVSGTASLIFSEKPGLTAEQVKRMVVYSAKDIDVPGRDQYTGYGLLDAKAALAADPEYFLEARIDGIKLNQAAGSALFEVKGTADADQLKAAWLEIGQGETPAKWKAVGEKLQGSVKEGLLGSFGLEAVKGANTWVVRLIAEHRNGKKQEARYVLNLQ